MFEDLPVVIVDDCEKITTEFLEEQWDIIIKKINEYNFDKMYSSYWISKLKSIE